MIPSRSARPIRNREGSGFRVQNSNSATNARRLRSAGSGLRWISRLRTAGRQRFSSDLCRQEVQRPVSPRHDWPVGHLRRVRQISHVGAGLPSAKRLGNRLIRATGSPATSDTAGTFLEVLRREVVNPWPRLNPWGPNREDPAGRRPRRPQSAGVCGDIEVLNLELTSWRSSRSDRRCGNCSPIRCRTN